MFRDLSWMDRALCTGMDSEIFFPTPKKTKVNPTQYKAALAVCSACPVRQECLDYALRHRMIEDGIFG
ncbi:MAG: WhiB family transcriptional regulator [Actinobacteria bacterium]|nr:WhiB family transcriptional regulator [Actinomycetota bacterium]